MKHMITALLLATAFTTTRAMQKNLNELSILLSLDEDDRENTEQNNLACGMLINQAIAEFQLGNLHLFDGISGDNQCHLNALHIAELARDHAQETLDLTVWTKQNTLNQVIKYLTLNLLLNSASMQKKGVLRDRIAAFQNRKKTASCSKERILKFLQNRTIRERARIELTELTTQWILQASEKIRNQLGKELTDLAKTVTTTPKEELPVFPKYAGIELFLQRIKLTETPLVIKIKTITNEGTFLSICTTNADGKITTDIQQRDKDVPVIVIEGITIAEDTFHDDRPLQSFRDFMPLRGACPQTLFYNWCQKGKPQPKHRCLMCLNTTLKEDHQLVGLDVSHILRTISASFMNTLQKEVSSMLCSCTQLSIRFIESLRRAEEEDLCTEHPRLFFIEHMYPSMHNVAIASKRLLDHTPEEVMRELKK